ncbi:MAG: 16S rRNA (guanine(527)-N(7))-methyltransferase RsmG [Christensenellaceae bacterium]|nr:16S rRNA (guanine(527)-N(7))-methyltransferase RsmG [Christensenellaceae bacterium]
MYNYLKEQLDKFKIPFNNEKIGKLIAYHELLLEWNKKFNLTRIVDNIDAVDKHYIDSLAILKINDIKFENVKVIDVGTGAGLPGIPIAIFKESSRFYLLDSLKKRVEFLNEVVNQLGLKNVYTIHARAEDAALNFQFREHFDYAIARAVAPLSILSEYLLPFVKINCFSLCYKSKTAFDEVKNAKNAIKTLGGGNIKIINYKISDGDIERNMVIINKLKKTPYLERFYINNKSAYRV